MRESVHNCNGEETDNLQSLAVTHPGQTSFLLRGMAECLEIGTFTALGSSPCAGESLCSMHMDGWMVRD